MKLNDIINESVTFNIIKYNSQNDRWEFDDEKVVKECEACDGIGKDEYGQCSYCNGTGRYETWESNYDELNVSNENALMILQDLLGTGLQAYSEEGLVGMIDPKNLANIKRRLIGIKNKDKSLYTKNPEEIHRRTKHTDEDGITKIGRTSMYHMGRSEKQVERYVDVLIKMIDDAQKIGGTINWA